MATSGPADPLDRRRFLRFAGAAAASLGAGAAAGCTTARHSATGRTTSSTSHPPSGPPDWRVLAASLQGSLVLPTNSSYPTDAQLYNTVFAPSPAAIAYCATTSDVQRCLAFARAHDVPLAARSGGHSYGGYSSSAGLVVDVSSLSNVTSPSNGDGGTVTQIGAGTKLIDVYTQLGSSGFLLPGGSCPSVGIAGLALGGGIGVFGRAYGMTCDHITGVEIVTADGMLRRCGPSQQEDLYWASRGGGGGNFGVVTSFTFGVEPIPDVTLFTLEWPWSAVGDVLGAWMQWMPFTPHALWSNCQLYPSGPRGGIVKVTGVFTGSVAPCASALSPLTTSIGTSPTDNFVGPEDYLRAMLIEAGCENETSSACAAADTRYPFTAKSTYLDSALSDSTISALVTTLESFSSTVPGGGGGLVLDGYGGAINEVAPSATAFVHRSAIACAQYSVTFPAATPSASVRAGAAEWLSQLAAVLAPVGQGSYQNYIDPSLSDWATAYYGANLPRLRQIKGRYDPDDVFHFAQSIPLPA